ncbi:MAG: DAK2 domain-containing protein [Actinophytocola sp.]|nr:DAK2 domain-containing protein [Actinophytocola sp.]
MRAMDAAAVVAWAAACVRRLDELRAGIDSINVYPVPDSDTGSNLLHTVTGANATLADERPAGAGQALATLAKGAVASARGNSGVIMSQLLRGLAESAGDAEELDGRGLARALAAAERMATNAVARPVDGTMLTVLAEAAGAAGRAATASGTLDEVAKAAASEAAFALERTPQQLAALADAGVVDAGGRGVLAVLDELLAVVTGEPGNERPEFAMPDDLAVLPAAGRVLVSSQPWEVMYLLDGVTEAALPQLRDELSELGDCVTIAGDGAGSHAVHVHCGDIGSAIEVGLRVGRPREVRVESLVSTVANPAGGRAVLAVVVGDELAQLCRHEGITVLGAGDGRGNAEPPSPRDIERMIIEMAASHVIVLPGNGELTEIAEQAAERAVGRAHDVVVIPCASPVQLLAALAVHDEGRRPADDVVAMAEAAAATRRGELAIAAEDAITWVGRAHAGDLVGFVDDEVVLIEPVAASGRSVTMFAETALSLLERMLSAGGELVTLLLGSDAPDGLADAVAQRLAEDHPEVEFAAYPGGQAESVLILGVE